MGIIVKSHNFTNSQTAEASSVNENFSQVFSLVNGNLNSANLEASGVAASNIQTSAVVTRAIDGSAVTGDKIKNETIQFSKQDYEVVLMAQEVL